MSTKYSGTRQTELLTEDNFPSWFVNIRAELRTKKLWKYTQEVYKSEEATEEGQEKTLTKKEKKTIKEWQEGCQDSADLMTPTISPGIKLKLTEAEFNDGYLMLTKLRFELQPSGFSEFIRLYKEYFRLQLNTFNSISEYLTHIKVLEEKIDATKIILDANTRTVLCLSMSLPPEYQYLIQIWATMPTPVTAEKARQMALEASIQHTQARSQAPARHAMQVEYTKCKYCGSNRHHHEKCWIEHPDMAPEWFKDRMKSRIGTQVRKF